MFGTDADQDNTRDRAFPAKNKIAKVLVLGEKDSLFTQRERDYICVTQTSSGLPDIEHVVTVRAQKRD